MKTRDDSSARLLIIVHIGVNLSKILGGLIALIPPPIAFPSRPRVLLYAANLIKSNMRLLGIKL